jgi:hypothetical protein
MRVGLNPMRRKYAEEMGNCIAAAIVHLPDIESQYHKQRLEVVQTSLLTMRDRAGVDYLKTYIWDNGSCAWMRDWLIYEYQPDYLMLSANIGKSSARAGIVRSLPDDVIIGVADDDMYYYQDWMAASIDILDTFPNVGQVSAYPVRTQHRWGNASTLYWAGNTDGADVQTGKFISEQEDMDFCVSIGRDYKYHLQQSANDMDCLITYGGRQVFATAHHCQWVGLAGVIKEFCIWDDKATADEHLFDNAVDAAGLLRLTTRRRYARHIGNVLEPDMMEVLNV